MVELDGFDNMGFVILFLFDMGFAVLQLIMPRAGKPL